MPIPSPFLARNVSIAFVSPPTFLVQPNSFCKPRFPLTSVHARFLPLPKNMLTSSITSFAWLKSSSKLSPYLALAALTRSPSCEDTVFPASLLSISALFTFSSLSAGINALSSSSVGIGAYFPSES